MTASAFPLSYVDHRRFIANTSRYFSRLCPGNWEPHDDSLLSELAELMKDSDAKRKARGARSKTMPSGYVYFGQFIAHDLIREQPGNFHTARLDLEQLYGEKNRTVCIREDEGRLLLGETVATTSGPGSHVMRRDDLPRSATGTAKVADPRSDENLIVAQMHVLWSKLHNYLFDLLVEIPKIGRGVPGEGLFARTRNLVTWHYQWIVWHDFLPHVVRLNVLRELEHNGPRLFDRRYAPADDLIELPIEFAMAAFRFGHSMVQQNYRIDYNRFLALSEILKMTKLGGGVTAKLPSDHVIDWRVFFGRETALLNRGENIDTFITEQLYELGGVDVEAFVKLLSNVVPKELLPKQGKLRLPALTLTRGSNARLPSGEEFAKSFRCEPLSRRQIPALPQDESFFKRDGIRGRTPLWYYLLREAAVEEKPEPATGADPEPIQKLGRIGSRIVAETIYQVLSADRNSIFNAGKNWAPPMIELPSTKELFRLRTMADVVNILRATKAA